MHARADQRQHDGIAGQRNRREGLRAYTVHSYSVPPGLASRQCGPWVVLKISGKDFSHVLLSCGSN